MAAQSQASVYTFHDETASPMTISLDSGPGGLSFICGAPGFSNDNCSFNFYRNVDIISALVPSGALPFVNLYSTPVLDADLSLSARLYSGVNGRTFQGYMLSRIEGGGPQGSCFNDACSASFPQLPAIHEAPGRQFHSQVTWADGQVDTFYFITQPGGVPEPATWGLMILGFGLAGATLRRRTAVKA